MQYERRSFQAGVLQCPCGGRRKVTVFIPGGKLARQILEKLGVEATGPPIAKARARPHQEHFDLYPEDPGADPPIQFPDARVPFEVRIAAGRRAA